jgi:hypothetical protein
LKCTWIYKWVSSVSGKRVIHQCLGAPRKQNSYNSGVWLDYTTQTVENQEVMWLPTNDDTKTILYDTKILKSSEGRYPPLRWTVTKIEDTATEGISKFTMAQDFFDPSKDNADLMIADYWQSAVEPDIPEIEEIPVMNDLEIVYSGSPVIRAGGSYKKFTLKTRVNDELIDATDVEWEILFPDNNLDKLEFTKNNNVLKVKCLPFYDLVGKTFTIIAASKNNKKSLIVEVISL